MNLLLKLAYQVPLTFPANTNVSDTQCFSIWKTNDTIYELNYTELLLYGKTRDYRNSHASRIFEWVSFSGFPGGEKGRALSEGPGNCEWKFTGTIKQLYIESSLGRINNYIKSILGNPGYININLHTLSLSLVFF